MKSLAALLTTALICTTGYAAPHNDTVGPGHDVHGLPITVKKVCRACRV